MPEMPEVETIRRILEQRLIGRRIGRVELLAPKFIRHPSAKEFIPRVTGSAIEGLERRGKYLIFRLSTGNRLAAHLKMAGRLLYTSADEPRHKHTHIIFHLDNGSHLRYVDLRHFGGFYLIGPDDCGIPAGLATLGPEPLGSAFTSDYLRQALACRKTKIKLLLLDQRVLAGLGNIYADECLSIAGIHPARSAGDLTAEEIERLHKAIRLVLERSIEKGGTTFATYVDAEGKRGLFAEDLRVYRRTGQSCPNCGTPVERLRFGGRSSHFCPQCQK